MSHASPVYVVDDDGDAAASLEALLVSKGYRVQTFNSAQAFLDAYDPARGGCVVLDARLENVSGLAVHRALVAHDRALPTILVSGHADESMRKEAIASGALALLEKPFAGTELCQFVEQAMAETPGI